MAITDETIEYVAALAKLDLTDEEKQVSSRCLMYLPIIMFSGRTL